MSEATAEELFARIRDDDIKGASELSRAAARALKLRAREVETGEVAEFAAELEAFVDRLIEDKPSMASIYNVVTATLEVLPAEGDGERDDDRTVGELREAVAERADDLVARSEAALERQAEYGANLIEDGDTVLMHSYSGSVLGVLREAADRGTDFRVIATESRPLYEGHETAAALLDAGVETTLIVDSAVGSFVERADAVLVGADSVLADGTVVNKVGTYPLALAAADRGVPVHVAVETMKFDPRSLEGHPPRIDEHPPEEVVDPGEFGAEAAELLSVENPFFEPVPPEHVDRLVTGEGVVPPAGIHAAFERSPW